MTELTIMVKLILLIVRKETTEGQYIGRRMAARESAKKKRLDLVPYGKS